MAMAMAMEWEQYKALCDSPRVWSRWMLVQTAELIADAGLATRLRTALTGVPVPKPAGHRGGAETDMFELELTVAEARAVLAAVEAAVHSGATTSATRRRGLGGFVEAWTEYLRHLQSRPVGFDCSRKS